MNTLLYPSREIWPDILKRPVAPFENIEATVKQIFKEVSAKGDAAVIKYTHFFDDVRLTEIKVTEAEIAKAAALVPEALKTAIQEAKRNIESFHTAQKTETIALETTAGVRCWISKKPIQKIGLYIPGGSAPLFSTVLMLAVPAAIAGCKEIVLCTPPDKNGQVNPVILYTAGICGITTVIKAGGIQAIAGMTVGTAAIPKVYKIFGPGNSFVTGAKQYAAQLGTAIDMPAGPSELLVFADESANIQFVSADLLSQAEHGPDSQVVLVTTTPEIAAAVKKEIQKQLTRLPRKAIVERALQNSRFIVVENDAVALELINEYAPEHLIICSRQEAFFTEGIQNAGSVFLGNYSPESAGDYASGTNHTLPTNGFAKSYSGVNLDSFLKSVTFQKISPEGIQNIGKTIEIMAEAEGLQAHKNAVTLRLNELTDENI